MPLGDIIKTFLPKCIHNINSILVYHNRFQKSSPTKAFRSVHATKATNNLSLVLLQAIALLQEPILHLFIHSKQRKVILLMRRVATTTTGIHHNPRIRGITVKIPERGVLAAE
jgi:hypothetical protein